MSGSSSPGQELAAAQARLAALRAARSGLVLGAAGGVTQIRYPDGSGISYDTVPARLGAVTRLDLEIEQAEELVLRLMGGRPRRPIRQVRVVSSKGL